MTEETLKALFETNPGILTIFFTGIVFPLVFVFLNNRHSRKMKETDKKLDLDFQSKEDIRKQEKLVYSSLSKILFDVQQLHVNLSGTCVDKNCIQDALKKFDESVNKCHEVIADNMLYLSSKSINQVYTFYNQISDLKIRLKKLNEEKHFDLAHVVVYYSSQNLANTVIGLQELFLKERTELQIEFDKTHQDMMKYCCGQEPPKELIYKYNQLKNTLLAGNY
jgi:hypothetical protein